MKYFQYYSPTEIHFGEGAEKAIPELVRKHGGSRVMVVYGGSSAKKSGLIDRILKGLEDAGIPARAEGGVVPNPLLSTLRRMIRAAAEFRPDFLIAAGGGSVIDTTKALSVAALHPDKDIWDFWLQKEKVDKCLPIGAVLTISAAGSETSNSAVITNDEVTPPTKRGLNSDLYRCKFAIMDPCLTMTLPVWQVGAGVADIFMHTSERYFAAILGNHLTDEIAEGLFRDIIKWGPVGVKDSHNYEAMSEIMWCGSVSHIGLTGLGSKGETPRDGDWSCHQLGMAISALYDSTHGATLTAVWGSWARYVMDTNLPRFASFARKVYGINLEDDRAAANAGIACTEQFFRSLGMPLSISELLGHEVTDEELLALTQECSYGRGRKIGSFKSLDWDDMLAIYQAAR